MEGARERAERGARLWIERAELTPIAHEPIIAWRQESRLGKRTDGIVHISVPIPLLTDASGARASQPRNMKFHWRAVLGHCVQSLWIRQPYVIRAAGCSPCFRAGKQSTHGDIQALVIPTVSTIQTNIHVYRVPTPGLVSSCMRPVVMRAVPRGPPCRLCVFPCSSCRYREKSMRDRAPIRTSDARPT